MMLLLGQKFYCSRIEYYSQYFWYSHNTNTNSKSLMHISIIKWNHWIHQQYKIIPVKSWFIAKYCKNVVCIVWTTLTVPCSSNYYQRNLALSLLHQQATSPSSFSSSCSNLILVIDCGFLQLLITLQTWKPEHEIWVEEQLQHAVE